MHATLIFVTFITSAFSQEYFARGEIEVIIKSEAIDVGERESLRFYVEVLNEDYKIRIEEIKLSGSYYEYAHENGLMHILHHDTSSNIKRVANRSGNTNIVTNLFPARIELRDIPPNDGTYAQYIWFALASHPFFLKLTNSIMLPIWSPEDPVLRKQPFEMLFFPEMMKESPKLPQKIAFYNEGYYRSYNPATKTLDVIKLRSPYDKGFTNATYQALALTNVGKITVPQKFIFKVYSTPLNRGQIPFERVLVSGVTKEVGMKAAERVKLASFDGVASVADYRLGGATTSTQGKSANNYIPYQVTNGAWLDLNQLAQVKARNDQVLLVNKMSDRTQKSIRGVFAITALAFVLLVIRAMRKPQK